MVYVIVWHCHSMAFPYTMCMSHRKCEFHLDDQGLIVWENVESTMLIHDASNCIFCYSVDDKREVFSF